MAGDARKIAGVRPGDGLQNEQRIFDGAGHGAELVERPAESHRAGARHAAISGAQPGDAATHAGADDAAAGLASNREADEACCCCGTGTRAGAGRAFFEQPRIHGLAAEPNVV